MNPCGVMISVRRIRMVVLVLLVLGLLSPVGPAASDSQVGLDVRVLTPAFELVDDGVAVPRYAFNDVPGAPRLPVYAAVIELPASGRWELDFVSDASRVLEQRIAVPAVPVPLVDHAMSAPGDPMGGVVALLTDDRPDPAIYGRDAYYPHSPVVAGAEQWQRGKRLLSVRVFPFQHNPVTGETRYHPDITVKVRILPAPQSADTVWATTAAAAETPAAITSELGALRIRTGQQGMHRLTYDDLVAADPQSVTVHPDNFAMTYLDQPIRIQIIGGEDGSFDPGDLVLFYARAYTGRWMPSNVYRFSYGDQAADAATTRMTTRTVEPTGSEPVVTTVTQVVRIDPNKAYFSDYWIDTEADHFFDTVLTANTSSGTVTRSYDLALDDPITTDATLSLSIKGLIYGVSQQPQTPDHWAQLKLNAHEVSTYAWDGRVPQPIAPVAVPATLLDQPINQLILVADQGKATTGITEYKYNPDFLELSYPATADAELDRIEILALQDAAVTTDATVQVTGFTTDQVRVYDVRRPEQPVQLLTTSATDRGDGTFMIGFWDAWPSDDPAPAYWLSTLDQNALLAPVAVEVDQPSHWRSPDHTADYIAIVHASLWDAIQPLLDRRAADGLAIAKVNIQDIYDEFNGGHLHQNAIREFLSYAYSNWNGDGERPKYVLLVGDGTIDFKGTTSTTLKNLVPPFLINIDPWLVETAADNRFVTFDGPDDYMPEMIVSRIPAQSPAEVTNYVDKVAAYEDPIATPDGPWQNRVVYVADDEETGAGNFHLFSDDIQTNWLPAYYETGSIYHNPNSIPAGVGLKTAPDMKAAIRQAFDDGAIHIQWFGHASRFRWGNESLWNILDVPTLAPNSTLPFVAAYSCWEGYFHNIGSNYPALAERHLLQAGAGSIGGLSPSGLHLGEALRVLDQGLTKSFFQDRIAATGDAVDAARSYYYANTDSSWHDVIDTSILFGDPALKLRLPVPPPVAPDVDIAHSASEGVDLSWPHLEPDATYEIWRGASPYFDPEDAGIQVGTVDAQAAGVSAGDEVHFDDDGAVGPVQVVGNVDNNYYWVVRGANWRGVSPDSNRVGEFDFALVRGQ